MTVITAEEFGRRRKQLASSINGGLLVLSAHDLMQQTADMAHPFRQEANFLYLTGLHEPGWQMIYDGMRNKCWLVRPERSEVEILFGGDTLNEQVLRACGANHIITQAELDATLRQMKRQHATVYTSKPSAESFSLVLNPAQRRLVLRLERIFTSVDSVEKEMANMRAIKQPGEIQLIKRAIAISAKAFATVRENILNYKYEYEVEAEFWYEFRKNNAIHAYSPIVAAGSNATILHYEKNDAKLLRKHLLLMDCGASVEGYNADVTRTIAVGEPTDVQRKTYDALLEAHQEIVHLIRPGLSFVEYQNKVDVIMKRALNSLGLLEDTNDNKTYRRYFPHAISHGLGIDVHESLGSSNFFKPGMVLTVEPGIYDSKKGLGIRIEDNILVTDKGNLNLTKAISTEVV